MHLPSVCTLRCAQRGELAAREQWTYPAAAAAGQAGVLVSFFFVLRQVDTLLAEDEKNPETAPELPGGSIDPRRQANAPTRTRRYVTDPYQQTALLTFIKCATPWQIDRAPQYRGRQLRGRTWYSCSG